MVRMEEENAANARIKGKKRDQKNYNSFENPNAVEKAEIDEDDDSDELSVVPVDKY